MKLVIDTNVFLSGVFFSGPPYQILKAWRHGRVKLVASPEIINEYRRAGEELARRFRELDFDFWLALIAAEAVVVSAPALPAPVCTDPEDDKFLACAVASGAKLVCSGDKALLKVSGYRGIKVLKPRAFVDTYLREKRSPPPP